LNGLTEEGFALNWNLNKKGLIGAATGTTICLWDVEKLDEAGQPIINIADSHENTINDLKFSIKNENIFGTASDDHHFKLWDIRTP